MGNLISRLRSYITSKDELNIILFKVLGLGGIGISIASGISCLIAEDWLSAAINGTAAILAILLMYFVEKTGRYVIGYIIVDVAVFMFLFAVLFFTGEGLDGAMPYYFSFALMFSFLMFEGKTLIVMETLLSGFYMGLMTVSIVYPQLVQNPGNSLPMKRERIIGVFIPALAMGLIFLLYIHQYLKQKQIADEANRAKSIFLANMSHEIRTPINAVLGFNEIIQKSTKETDTREYAGYIDQSGHRLLNVINEVLDYSKMESGNGELVAEIFSLRELAEEMKAMMGVLAKDSSTDYRLDYDDSITDMVMGDRGKLVRILTNLISNAFKYTKEGHVILYIRKREVTESRQKIYFAVEDTGIGIHKSEIENIFHAYERADLMKNRNIEGTGLGLAITGQLLELMGSSVQVESVYGEGSTFSFEIVFDQAQVNSAPIEEAEEELSFSAPQARVLAVDDDEMNRKLMNSFLSMLKISADFAESGEECLKILGTKNYDLIFMDYMMPGMDGLMAMEKIREREKKIGTHTPIVVLTADVVDRIEQKLKESGFDEYLSKPVNFDELKKALLKYIPEELIIEERTGENAYIPEKDHRACEEMLEGYGVVFAEGMKLVNGDYGQYLRIAGFFIDTSDEGMTKLRKGAEDGDTEALRISMHSLKAKAGSIGAEELRSLAEKLESRCISGDRDYVLYSIDLLLLLWERCVQGLKRLPEMGEESSQKEKTQFDGYSFENLVAELGRSLELCEGKRARMIIKLLKDSETGESSMQLLDRICELIDEMEFEEAARKAEEGLN